MGSNLSCVGSDDKNNKYIDNVYDEANEGEDLTTSPTRDSGFSSLNTKTKSPTKNNNDSSSKAAGNKKNAAKHSAGGSLDHTDNGNDDKGKFHLQHDSKGYTLVVPKGSPTLSKPPTTPSSPESQSSPTNKKAALVPNGKHNRKSSPPRNSNTPQKKNAKAAKNKISMDSGSYCNIELPDSTENNNKPTDGLVALGEEIQDDIYQNEVPVPPKPVVKPRSPKVALKQINENAGLKYVEVEVVSPKQVSKGKQPEKKKPPSPSVQYTEVVEENGVVKLVR